MYNQMKTEEDKNVDSIVEQASLEGGLVIEDNTIYEIDEDCMECLKKGKNHL